MNQLEVARVQLRKIEQQKADLRAKLLEETAGLLSAGMIDGLCGCLDDATWIAGHGYELEVEQEDPDAGAVLVSRGGKRPRLLMHFLGRSPVPPFGGFVADIYSEDSGGWKRLAGLADWRPEQWMELDSLWASPEDD